MRLSVAAIFAAVALGAAQSAAAADIPARMPAKAPAQVVAHSWTGCYLGVNAGYLWARTGLTDLSGADFGSETANGAVAGGQVGCDYQTGRWVFGVEGMMDWTNADGSHNVTDCCLFTTDMKWIATVTGRIGYAVNNSLFYVKGGGAWANLSHTQTLLSTVAVIDSYTRSGWTVGAGWEYRFRRGWSAKIEYNYLDLGSSSPVACIVTEVPPLCGLGGTIDQTAHLVLVGLNYRVGGR